MNLTHFVKRDRFKRRQRKAKEQSWFVCQEGNTICSVVQFGTKKHSDSLHCPKSEYEREREIEREREGKMKV